MLREEVLREWGKVKGEITSLNKDMEFLTEQTMFESSLPNFPLDYDTARRNLDFWTSAKLSVKIQTNKEKVLSVESDKLSGWIMVYLNSVSMFEVLTKGWKKERDKFDRFQEDNPGPTIEEVD